MSLTVGQEFAHYRVVSLLGSGAMGQVFRARDTRLERDVAVKVLSDDVAGDPERLTRLEREAKVLASLNHANIGQIHAVEPWSGSSILVLELVEGEDLSARLERGALPVAEAVSVCAQIAEGLEAAHEAGVIHRDLKPANVRLTPRGTAKVLDFGLAKPVQAEKGDGAKLTTLTGQGVLVGTPTYMSPEAVRGNPLDRRTDVWAFGCILFECLTGERAFDAGSLPDLVASILERQPDLGRLPSATPPAVRRLVERCLDKDPRTRLQDMGEARIALRGGVPSPESEPVHARTRTRLPWVVAAALALALLILGKQWPAPPPRNPLEDPVPRRLYLPGSEFDVAVSSAGDSVLFASDREGVVDLWRLSLAEGEPMNLTRGRFPLVDELVRNLGFKGSVPWAQKATDMAVYKVQDSGSADQALLAGANAVEPDSTQDGSRVVYHIRAPGDPIFVRGDLEPQGEPIRSAGQGRHQHYAVWSVDEDWIYFVAGIPAIWDMHLWRMRPDGSDPQQLTTDLLNVKFPTPIDERTVLFIAHKKDGSGPYIWSLDVPSGRVTRAAGGIVKYTSLQASDDGRTVAAVLAEPWEALWQVPIPAAGAGVSRESDAEVLPVPVARARSPRHAGDALFFQSSFGGGEGLYRMQEDQLRELWLEPAEPLLFAPEVSPRGTWVALIRRGEDGLMLSLLDVRSPGQIARNLGGRVDVRGTSTWSPDERFIAVGGIDADGAGLFVCTVADGTWTKIYSGTVLDPSWSPTEDVIVFGVNTEGWQVEMRAVDHEGHTVALPLDRMASRFRMGAPLRFTADGRHLVYLGYQAEPFRRQFWSLDLATGDSRLLTDLDLAGDIRGFDLSPDGQSIVFDRIDQNSDVVVFQLGERR